MSGLDDIHVTQLPFEKFDTTWLMSQGIGFHVQGLVLNILGVRYWDVSSERFEGLGSGIDKFRVCGFTEVEWDGSPERAAKTFEVAQFVGSGSGRSGLRVTVVTSRLHGLGRMVTGAEFDRNGVRRIAKDGDEEL